jgi:hypothetical protein
MTMVLDPDAYKVIPPRPKPAAHAWRPTAAEVRYAIYEHLSRPTGESVGFAPGELDDDMRRFHEMVCAVRERSAAEHGPEVVRKVATAFDSGFLAGLACAFMRLRP